MANPKYSLIAGCLVMLVCSGATVSTATSQSHSIPNQDQILALDSHLKDLVEEKVMRFMSTEQRVRALMSLMYDPDKMGLVYQTAETRTAVEAVKHGGGNCISLANTLVALGRYAGLHVEFVSAQLKENWKRQGDVLLVTRHTTARVELDSGAHVTIEFDWIIPRGKGRYEVISDERAFSEFYTNLAVDLMAAGKSAAAVTHLDQALRIDPKFTYAWNNLGVAYRQLGQVEEAERAFRQSLKMDRMNLSALINLDLLYRSLGQKIAVKLQRRLDNYRRRNPYYLIELAEECITEGEYKAALRLAKKAIRKQEDESHFYFVLARAYAYLDRFRQLEKSLEKAQSRAENEDSRARYQRKLDLVRRRTG
ncbi:MAG: tetratricopeptide repeat protein [bacterium]|nr:tetratricopeptide repeat protein [bacterium]